MLRRKRGFSRRSLRPSLYSAPREREEPFYVTLFKVGSTLLALGAVFYLVIIGRVTSNNNDYGIPYREHLLVKHADTDVEFKEDNKVMILPTFTLSAKSQNDAFGIADQHLTNVKQDAPKEVLQFLDTAKKLRGEFSERYGGIVSARALLGRSLAVLRNQNVESSNNAMTFRIHSAQRESGVLNMAFGGSSAVAGYGNFFHQSFPFIVENLLKDPLELLGLTLKVRNGAIEHTSAFPYMWCRSNLLGNNVHMTSIDFGSMPLDQLETVMRNVVGSEQEVAPILVFRDALTTSERLSLIQR